MLKLLFALATLANAAPYSLSQRIELIAPPAVGTEESDADFSELLKLQKQRTQEQCDRASSEIPVTLKAFFGGTGGSLTDPEIEKLSPFFERIRETAGAAIGPLKSRWKRARPFVVDPKLSPCIQKETTTAYPSGHATIALIYAKVLAEIYPEIKGDLELRARQIGEDRILGGVHYPSDVRAGRELGARIFAMLLKNNEFQRDLGQMQKRMRQ